MKKTMGVTKVDDCTLSKRFQQFKVISLLMKVLLKKKKHSFVLLFIPQLIHAEVRFMLEGADGVAKKIDTLNNQSNIKPNNYNFFIIIFYN